MPDGVDGDLLDRWASEEQLVADGPARDLSWLVALVVVVALVAAAVAGGRFLIERSGGGEDARADGPRGEDATASEVLAEEAPSLEDLTSEVTLPPGPDVGLAVAETGVTVVEDRFDPERREGTYAVVLRNPHDDWLAVGVRVQVTLLGGGGAPLVEDQGFIEVVLPGQRVAVGALVFDAPAEPVVDVAVDVDVARWRETGPVPGGFDLVETETTAAEFSGVVTRFELTSRFDVALTDVTVVAVHRDAEGRILGGADAFVELVEPGVPTAGEVSLLANLDPEAVAGTELFASAAFGSVPGDGPVDDDGR